jgi:hypothetical protein
VGFRQTADPATFHDPPFWPVVNQQPVCRPAYPASSSSSALLSVNATQAEWLTPVHPCPIIRHMTKNNVD